MPEHKSLRILVLAALAAPCLTVGAEDASKVDFSRDIRPILSNHCFQCHGPDEEQRQADLRLDQGVGAMADLGGYAAVVPHKVNDSELIERVTSSDDDLRMPPP